MWFSFLSLILFTTSALAQFKRPISAQNATVSSLIYGLPLSIYAPTANSIANQTGVWMTNTLFHATALEDPSSHSVVLFNVDTLYSRAVLDLSHGDLIATMPAMDPGRFVVWPFYDIFGNDVCNFGTVTNSTAGKYRVTYRAGNPGCEAARGDSEYAGTAYLPTAYGITFLRIEVGNASDVAHVVTEIQPGFTLASLPPHHAPSAPPLTPELLNSDPASGNTPLYIMQLLARLAAFSPPEVLSDAPTIDATLAAAGVHVAAQRYIPPAGVDLSRAFAAAQAAYAAIPTSPAWITLGGAWSTLAPAVAGDFGTAYTARAYIAVNAYLLLSADQAVYPFFAVTETLSSNETYVLEFGGGKPRVTGFWSLTVYDAAGFLVPNPVDRYALGDRSNMTYPDGTRVYGGTSPANSTEPFYMLLQAADNPPTAAEWAPNWLPTPAGGAAFRFVLRWFGPTAALLDGTYTYPTLTAVAANPPLPRTGPSSE
ncbi:hypothetical protein GGX14DRAFT_494805 [Mycena pura]|uniref:DUF1254 domain-containing protein n=1 Tax=Mycena pura TaxID=153505 RepID=A0AAD6YI39_9AGAR|nr:hypothetical protein GGX14DRAFT_494805 [Mycena pura]